MNPTFCRGCGKPMRWEQTAGGRWLPLNPDPDPEGTIRVDVVRNVAYDVVKGSHRPLYRLHRETCTKPWNGARK